MKLFYYTNPKTIVESLTAPLAPKILDEIDALADNIQANMGKEIKVPKDVLDSFKIKDTLNQDIWDTDVLNPEVRAKLIRIANDFYKDLNLPKEAKIKDIIFTGSLANFNWSKFSDIDLHIVIDFKQFDAEPQMVEDYFYAQKSIWNQEHDIDIKGFPVELYVQNTNAKLVATAVYSVLNNKWIKQPKREEFKLDKQTIKDKADKIIFILRDIRQDYQDKQYQTVVDKVKKLKDYIKRMRNAGLEKGGEMALENLVFKVLRRTNFMDQLDAFKAKAYDKLMSVAEAAPIDIIDEGDVLDNSSFKYKRESEDELVINAIYNGEIIGKLSMGFMMSAYWYFEDEFSEEQYDEMFPDDKFVLIGWLEVPQNKYKGEGIAKELMKRAITKTKQQGYNTMYLNASPVGNQGLQLSDLKGFYESFGFKETLHQGGNVQMIKYINPPKPIEETDINEANNLYKVGGVLFIKGAKLQDGTQRLYVTTTKNIMGLERLKVDDTKGLPATMAILGDDIYVINLVDGKLKPQKVGFPNEGTMLKFLGLTRRDVALNNNKTPLHWETLKSNNIAQTVHNLNGQILGLPNIKFT